MKRALMLGSVLILSACATTPRPPRTQAAVNVAPPSIVPTGLDRVIGRNAASLISLFGNADQDVREENSRKLHGGLYPTHPEMQIFLNRCGRQFPTYRHE